MSFMQTPAEVPQPSPAPSVSFHWRPSHLYHGGVQTYRVTVAFVARVWTPPPMFDGVESASFVFLLSSVLFVMEGFHAFRYTLRQLQRFKTEAAFRHISLIAGVPQVARAETDAEPNEKDDAESVHAKSHEALDAEDGDTTERPPSWLQRILLRVSAVLPTRAATSTVTLSDVSDDDAAAARPLRCGEPEESEYDFMSRDVSVPFEMSNLPTQRGESQMSYGTTEGGPHMGSHDDGAGEEDEEEEQTWEATPEMLMHYWKQLERTILIAPRRNVRRFFRCLPEEMQSYEPDLDAVNTWFDGVTQHLHDGASVWSFFTAGVATEDKEIAAVAGAPVRPRGCPQRLCFTVPPNGCFAYREKPPPEDFYADTEEDSEASSDEYSAANEGDSNAQGRAASSSHSVDVEVSAPSTARTVAGGDSEAKKETDSAAEATTSQPHHEHRERRHVLRWEALMLVWFNVAEVSMSAREIRALLLKASPPAFLSPAKVRDDGPTDFDLASTNLSLLWYWSTLQRVFETLVVNEDVEKCEADFEELQAYAMPLFIKCIARWPAPSQMADAANAASKRGLVGFICVVQTTWMMLTAVHHRMLSLRRRLYYRNTWSLVRYMYSSSKAKIMSAALITVMMTISSRVSAAGRVVRERIANYVESSAEDGVAVPGDGGAKMNLRLMAGLCAFELTRMAVQYVISNTTSEFIVLTASQRREVVKMQLYEALSHTQLTFYEQHTYEEVEEIIYYVSDMEGIDVQLHQYLFNAIHVFVELKDALQPFSYRSMVVAAAVAMAPYALRSIATMVEQRYLLAQREGYLPSGAYAVEDEYQGDDDDSNVLREGAMLRGDEIIAAIPQLRPYGADVRLVRWWNRHQQRRQHIKLSHHQRSNPHAALEEKKGGGGDISMKSSPRTARALSSAGAHGGVAGATGSRGGASSKSRVSWGEYLHSCVGSWVTDEDIGLVRSALVALVQLPHGKLLPGTGKAVLDLSEWLLPMAASAYGISWCGQSNLDPFQLVQGMQAIEAAVDSVSEAMDTAEMVGYNAYKASMLERLLQPTQWEVVSREEEPYMANFIISASGVGQANDERQSCIAHLPATSKSIGARLAPPPPSPLPLTVGPARTAGFYRRHVLRHIELLNIRLRYAPADPTERRKRRRSASGLSGARRSASASAAAAAASASGGSPSSATATPRSASQKSGGGGFDGTAVQRAASSDRTTEDEDDEDEEEEEDDDIVDDCAPLFSADIVLWSPPQQRGRFVCITAPNGGGKTALVNLLLALYVNANGPLPSSAASSPHAGRLGSGSVTFCFASRTHTRRHRRGGMTGRTGNASALNLARTGRSAYDSARPHDGGRRGRTSGAGGGASSPANTGRSMVAYSGRNAHGVSTDRLGGGHVEGPRAESRVDIRTIPADVLRRHIFSYVPEMPTIFSGATVAQNISLAGYVSVATDALMRRVTQCAELAQCDFVQRLPLGLLTRISDTTASSWNTAGQYSNGAGNTSVTRLSADQAKRLMLARAYFHGGEVLLMDEPTKEIEDAATAQKMCEGWRRQLERGYCSGVICVTMDAMLLKMADEVITLP